MRMPTLDQSVLDRRTDIIAALREIVPVTSVIDDERERAAYECDGLSVYRQLPFLVVLPENTRQVSEILRYCYENEIKVVPRGAGTSLSGGALPLGDGILLGLGKFNKILEIDWENGCARVQPGVTNQGITDAVSHRGFYLFDISGWHLVDLRFVFLYGSFV